MDNYNEKIIIEMYNKRRPIKSISKKVGMPEKTITKYLKDNNLWTGHRWLPYFYDEFFFDQIDSEAKAYWLGFIYADGYISKANEVGIELSIQDIDHLEKFKRDIQSEHQIHIYHKNSTFGPQDNARFSFGSKHIANILENYYGARNKTYEGKLPQIPEHLVHHMVRGVFDGDGCLSLRHDNNNFSNVIDPVISFTGTLETMKYIEQYSGFSWNWHERHPERDNNNYSISCGRVNNSMNFLNSIYDGASIYLGRKYEKYQRLVENRQKLQAKTRV